MNHFIEVTLVAGELVTAPEDNPREEVARGDTLIWQFKEGAAGQNLQVVVSGSSPFESGPQSLPDENRGTISQTVTGGSVFKYEIQKNGNNLPWKDRPDGGEFIIRIPPSR